MITARNLKLRDKKVERILESKGLQNATVFHGPRKIWWIGVAIVMTSGIFLFPLLYKLVGWYFIPLVLLYLAVGFVLSGRYFCSFALTDMELIVINPNPPFSRYAAFPLDQVRLVVMESQRNFLMDCFGLLSYNYIEVGTDEDLHLFRCAGIDEYEGYDDEGFGFTEKTLEDLAFMLKKKDIPVQFEF